MDGISFDDLMGILRCTKNNIVKSLYLISILIYYIFLILCFDNDLCALSDG